MSWTADIIYTIPNHEMINELKCNDDLNAEYGLYLIDNFKGIESEWTLELMSNKKSKNYQHYHSLPEQGLLAIKPLAYKTGYENDYSNYKYWQNRPLQIEPESEIYKLVHILKKNTKIEIPDNQIKIISFAEYLYTIYNQPIVYYRCETWGGSTEFEFGMVIENKPMLFLFVDDVERCVAFDGEKITSSKKSVLQNSLKFVHQELNTDFFALHQRSFNWEIYRI